MSNNQLHNEQTLETAADEMRAYDLLTALLRDEGTTTVLATLRAWHVLRELNRAPQCATSSVAGVTGHNIRGSI